MIAVLPGHIRASEPLIRFMHHFRRAHAETGTFASELPGRDVTKILIDKRRERIQRLVIALSPPNEESRNGRILFAQSLSCSIPSGRTKSVPRSRVERPY